MLVAALAPVVAFLRSRAWLRGYAVPTCAGAIFCCGGWWFVERAFLL